MCRRKDGTWNCMQQFRVVEISVTATSAIFLPHEFFFIPFTHTREFFVILSHFHSRYAEFSIFCYLLPVILSVVICYLLFVIHYSLSVICYPLFVIC